MSSRYKFSEKEIKAIEQRRKENKDKRAEARLKALELRAKNLFSIYLTAPKRDIIAEQEGVEADEKKLSE